MTTNIEEDRKCALEMLGDLAMAKTKEERVDALERLAGFYQGFDLTDAFEVDGAAISADEALRDDLLNYPMSLAEALVGLAVLFAPP
jgi:hypothetical protein